MRGSEMIKNKLKKKRIGPKAGESSRKPEKALGPGLGARRPGV